jgi:hypothetical protein
LETKVRSFHLVRRIASTSIVLLALCGSVALADREPELHWQWRIEPRDANAGDEAYIVFNADIPDGFILYSSDFAAELGPRPARFLFESTDAITLIGPIEAVNSQRRVDKTFGTEYTYFAHRAEFRQKVRLRKGADRVYGRIDGQTCQEKDGLCALFRQQFSIQLTAVATDAR